MTLGPAGIAAFEGRGINHETAVRYGAYTARRDESGGVVPAENGNIVAFPFVEHGAVVAEKYRAPGKQFWQRTGGKRTFWNADALDDPALETGAQPLVITEGELDALTAIDCGWPLAVSVPDGAPAVRDGEDPTKLEDVDETREPGGKFSFVWNNRDRLKRIKRFVIAVDNDAPGRRLEAELLRRLSPARCWFPTYPDGCKDLNDVLRAGGRDGVVACLNAIKPYPLRGLYRLGDYPDRPDPETFSCGLPGMDDLLKLWLGELVVVSGIPSHGKSTIVLNWCVNLAERYGWTIAIASFEIPTVPMLRHKLRLARLKAGPDQWRRSSVVIADAWIENHFVFIDDDPTGEGDEDLSLEWLLDRAGEAVMRDGIKALVIDPWNEVEHARSSRESESEYHNRALRMIRRFASRHNVIAVVVAHPTKDIVKDGKTRTPSLYDISGSAAWINKPDHGIIVDITDRERGITSVHVKKVRFNWSGKPGEVKLRYLPDVEGYAACEETASHVPF